MSGTISDWEQAQFVSQATAEINAVPVTEPRREVVGGSDGRPEGLVVWNARTNSGYHVQGLVDAEGRTYITAVLNGKSETFEVPRERAAEAFEHPYVFGATLPL